jgi:hypothetical protein
MAWLPITDSFPGHACPSCDRGELYVRSSRPTGIRWQVQYLGTPSRPDQGYDPCACASSGRS